MPDTLLPYLAPDGTRTLEEIGQFLGRQILPVGDAFQTIPQALADRPTQAEVAAALADAALSARGTAVGPDADWIIPLDGGHVVNPPLTASRLWALPDVDGYPRGQDLVIVDEGRFLGAGAEITLVPVMGSGDAIAGYPNGIPLRDAGASVRLRRGLLSNVWAVV